MARRVNRRACVKGGAAVLAGYWVAGHAASAAPSSPNEKLDLAVIGCARRGAANLAGVAGENLVALCDVDDRQAGPAYAKYPQAKKYRDFRIMLDQVGAKIDAVVVSTPDHTHAPAAVTAMRMGKHCYCEKPLAHTVYEVRVMRETARKHHCVTQLGTQIHAGDNYRRAVELVQAGVLGPVREVHVWFAGGYPGQDRPTETPPVPEGLDWDLWLGPARYRPYHSCYLPGTWRRWWDFGSGALGDFGCHYMDLAFWALGLAAPQSIEAEGPPVHAEGTPGWMIVRYTIPDKNGSPVRLTWYDGGKVPEPIEQKKVPGWKSGVLFVGAKGMLLADYTRHVLLPEAEMRGVQRPAPSIAKSVGHHQEWIDACKSGGTTTCNFDYSGNLSEAVLLGCVAYRMGKPVVWDAERLQAVGLPEADRLLRPEYRSGWKL